VNRADLARVRYCIAAAAVDHMPVDCFPILHSNYLSSSACSALEIRIPTAAAGIVAAAGVVEVVAEADVQSSGPGLASEDERHLGVHLG
jgi:hypothetical protein